VVWGGAGGGGGGGEVVVVVARRLTYLKIFLWRPRCDPLQYSSATAPRASISKDSMHPSSGLVISAIK
jgi:hypothetical protein